MINVNLQFPEQKTHYIYVTIACSVWRITRLNAVTGLRHGGWTCPPYHPLRYPIVRIQHIKV